MKKTFTILGSLLIAAGLKAQTVPTVRKETTPPVTNEQNPVGGTAIVKGDKNAIDTHIKHTTGTIKKTGTPVKLKNELQVKGHKLTNDTASKAIKITGVKEMKDAPALKKTNLNK